MSHDKAHIPPHDGATLNTEKPLRIRPLHDRVLVKRKEGQDKTPGGLHIPDVAKEKSSEAEVLAVGPGLFQSNGERRPVEVKPGDVVFLSSRYSGSELTVDGQKYTMLREEDVIGVKS